MSGDAGPAPSAVEGRGARAGDVRRGIGFGVLSAGIAVYVLMMLNQARPLGGTDFDQIWWAARCILDGTNPYQVIQPPRHSFPLYYPLTSALVTLPLALLDFRSARLVFVALSGGLFGYAVGRYRPWLWPAFLGPPFILFAAGGQWSALLSAAIILPWLGPLAAAKPNLGLAVLAGVASRRAAVLMVGGSLVILALSLAVDSGWPLDWVESLRRSDHFRPLILRPGGFLMLLALLRWRDPSSRLLLALAVVPTTGLPYDLLPAILVAENWRQAASLVLITQVAWLAAPGFPATEPYADWSWRVGISTLWSELIPPLALVLWRGWRPLAPGEAFRHLSPELAD